MLKGGPLEIHAVNQFRPSLTRLANITNFHHMQKKIFFSSHRRRNLNPPCSGNHVFAIRRQNLIEILTPEKFPHVAEFRIFWQRRTLWRFERPVLSRAPGADLIIPRAVEFMPVSSTPRDHTSF